MQSLLKTIEKVRDKISKYKSEVKKSEALTRYVLIDPILRVLGWDLECPDFVRPEFTTEAGTPDYALLVEGKPYIMVEVKPLGGNLTAARDKGFNYCWKNRVPYYVITDGEIWELYDMSKMGGEKIFSIDISRDNLGDISRKLLALWRPAMPFVEVAPEQLVKTRSMIGITLTKLSEKLRKGEKLSKPPRRVYFPDGKVEAIKVWRDILIAIVKNYERHFKEKIPIRFMYGKSILINKSSSGMRSPRRINDLWVETHFSAKGILRNSCYLLRLIGISPDKVYAEF